jgi:hypothetical protein
MDGQAQANIFKPYKKTKEQSYLLTDTAVSHLIAYPTPINLNYI